MQVFTPKKSLVRSQYRRGEQVGVAQPHRDEFPAESPDEAVGRISRIGSKDDRDSDADRPAADPCGRARAVSVRRHRRPPGAVPQVPRPRPVRPAHVATST